MSSSKMKQDGSNSDLPPLSANGSDRTETGRTAKPQVPGYSIMEKIGEGGMGSIWRAVQLSTRREVALKLIGAGALGSEKAHARFEREVEVAARLNHPNITSVFDSGLREGLYYYAMELIKGRPLDAYVQQHNLDFRQILELMHAVCKAVQHAHQSGVVHRDLKPSNILVTGDGQPHIVDFGLAKALLEPSSQLTLSMDGELVGTLPYMSPEQASGRHRELDTRTDVYSLGIILYRLLTGKPTHDLTGSNYIVMRRIAEEEVIRPRLQNPRIDKELEAVLLKALAHKPEDRYATAGELAADIERYLHTEPLAAKPPTIVYFLRKRIYKHRIPILVVMLIFAAIIIAVVTIAVVNTQKKSTTTRELKAQAASFIEEGSYEAAEEAFAKVLALNKNDPDARQGITEARNLRELARDLELARQSLRNLEFDRALGIALSAQQRFPEDEQVEAVVRRASGTTTLSVKFGLGELLDATLQRISTEANQAPVGLDVTQLADGVDIEPGWYWLGLTFIPDESESNRAQKTRRYLLYVRRSTPYRLDVRRMLVGNVPNADFTSLSEALGASRPGNILSLAAGEHKVRLGNETEFSRCQMLTPNLTITSQDSEAPATLIVWHLYVRTAWDVEFENLVIKGIKRPGEAFPGTIHFENCVSCRVTGCEVEDAAVNGENCYGIELRDNFFSGKMEHVNHRSIITDSHCVVIRGNTVEGTRAFGWRVFNVERSRRVMFLENIVGRAALTGIRLDRCSEAVVVGNEVRESHEGNTRLMSTDGGLVAYNELTDGSLYNISLFSSARAAVHHNVIRGGKAGIHLTESERSSCSRNLIIETNAGVLCSGAPHETIRENIFVNNAQCVAGEGTYWGLVTVEMNLMDRDIDPSALRNTDLEKKDNTICEFEVEQAGQQVHGYRIRASAPDIAAQLSDKEWGPAVDLESRYIEFWNHVADSALEFGRLAGALPVYDRLADDFVESTFELATRICSVGLSDLRNTALAKVQKGWSATLELTKNLGKIPTSANTFNNHHYVLYTVPKSWKDAKQICESVGGHLATVTSEEEERWIRSTLPPMWMVWLGGTDEKEEGNWQWVTGEPWQYAPWDKVQPDNHGGMEHGLCFYTGPGWNDGNMEWKLPFLIEWDK